MTTTTPQVEIRGMRKRNVQRTYGGAQLRIAYGFRYRADGWGEYEALYGAYAPLYGRGDVDEDAVTEYVKSLHIRGTAGAATHGCEDVRDVRVG